MDEIQAWMEWGAFVVAKAGLIAWLSGHNEDADDDTIADAHEFILDALSDADKARTIEAITRRSVRDLSVQEIEQIDREMRLRRFERRN